MDLSIMDAKIMENQPGVSGPTPHLRCTPGLGRIWCGLSLCGAFHWVIQCIKGGGCETISVLMAIAVPTV